MDFFTDGSSPFGVYWRVLSAPSSCTALPLVSVAANSEALPNTTQRCQVTLDLYSPVLGSFQLWLVASERTVNGVSLLWVRRTSASRPRNPRRVTRLIENMLFLLFRSRFPRGTKKRTKPLPRAKR